MINLLPQKEKEEISLKETQRLIIILGSLFFLSLISLTLILFSIKIYLSGQIETQKFTLELAIKERENLRVEEIENKIKEANQRLSQLENFYQKKSNFSEILGKINQSIPPGVYLKGFSFVKETSKVYLSGFAKTREDLIFLRKNLEENFQEKVEIPITNLVKAKDVDFSGVNFKISQPR